MAATCCEFIWLKLLLQDFLIDHFWPAMPYCDNKAAPYITANPMFYPRRKHIQVGRHFIRDEIQQGHVKTFHLASIIS